MLQPEPTKRLVFTLCVDMIGSTAAGLKLPSRGVERFNIAVVEQICPHIEALEISPSSLRFAGDGWLITVLPEELERLCCLALILASRFQQEVATSTGLPPSAVPSLRLAICGGNDIQLVLPEGATTWIGDSARRAIRSTQYCNPNEVLIDEPCRSFVVRDFEVELVDKTVRKSNRVALREEEDFPLHRLVGISESTTMEGFDTILFAHTRGIISGGGVDTATVERILGYLAQSTATKPTVGPEVKHAWHQLLAISTQYESARHVFESMEGAGVAGDEQCFTTLMSLAPTYEVACSWMELLKRCCGAVSPVPFNILMHKAPTHDTCIEWLDKMTSAGINPSVVTFNTLVNRAPSYGAAVLCNEQRVQAGLVATAVTMNTLMNRSPNYKSCWFWFKHFTAIGIMPTMRTYNILIRRSPSAELGRKWFDEMLAEGIPPTEVTYSHLIDWAETFQDAMEIQSSMVEGRITPGTYSLSALVRKSPSYEVSERFIGGMIEHRIELHSSAAAALARIAGSRKPSAEALLSKLRSLGLISTSAYFYAQLVASADFAAAKTIAIEAFESGVYGNDDFYTALFQKAETPKEVLDWLRANLKAIGEDWEIAAQAAAGRDGSYLGLLRLYHVLEAAGRKPTASLYEMLIGGAPTAEMAIHWVEEMADGGMAIRSQDFVNLLSRATTYSDAVRLYDKYESRVSRPISAQLFSHMISRAPNAAVASQWVGRMIDAGLPHSIAIHEILLGRSQNFDEALSYVERLQSEGIALRPHTITILLCKAHTRKDMELGLRKAREAGIQPSVDHFNSFIGKAETYSVASSWFDLMNKLSIRPNVETLRVMLTRAETAEDIEAVRVHARETGRPLSAEFYRTLAIKKADYYEAIAICHEMKSLGLWPHAETIRTVIRLAPGYSEAIALVDDLREYGMWPHAEILRTLISIAPDYATCVKLASELRFSGVWPHPEVIRGVLRRAPTYEEALRWFSELRAAGTRPVRADYHCLLRQESDWDTTARLLTEIETTGVRCNADTGSILLSRFRSLHDVWEQVIAHCSGLNVDLLALTCEDEDDSDQPRGKGL